MPVKTKSSGPLDARIMIIGEAPGAEEEVAGIPFVGSSGTELTRMLHEAGIARTECFLTNVCKYRPPMNEIESFFLDSKMTQPNELIKEGLEELRQEIATVKPKLIIALGNTSLWALTGKRGITKWRGSMLEHNGSMLMPTYHPAMILREWSHRAIAVLDLKRANAHFQNGSWPARDTKYLVRPSFSDAMDVLGMLIKRAREASEPVHLASDIETRLGYIACHGIAWSDTEAVCLPYLCIERPTGYWTFEEEVAIWERQRELMTHEHVEVSGQNYLYDAQYFARRSGYVPRLRHDTLFMQSVAFAGLPKGLDFLSSMYRRKHVYWKDEGKLWDPKTMPEDQLWGYNCEDACATFEIKNTLGGILKNLGQWDNYLYKMKIWHHALRMMLRGIKVDQLLRGKLAADLFEAIQARQHALTYILGHEINPRSPKQMSALFYGDLQCKVVLDRKTRKPTCNADALKKFGEREPLYRPITELIEDIRSFGVLLSNIVQAPLDADGRMRCSFNAAHAETLRWSSSENPFGGGTNLQNVTKGDEDDSEDSVKRVLKIDNLRTPNCRKVFVPDPGYTIAEIDQAGADAQVVAWEANDEKLKDLFRKRIKVHAVNARDIFGDRAGPDGKQEPYYTRTKVGVHLTNYGGKVRTLAAALESSEHDAARFQSRWFQLHPNISDWHDRIEELLSTKREVKNKFGYRRFYFDRIADLLPEALAWIPQSTVACVTDRVLDQIESDSKLTSELGVEVLLQVHDSIVFQYPTYLEDRVLTHLQPLTKVIIPYDDPLVIPWGLKTSTVSWGHCKDRKWPGEE